MNNIDTIIKNAKVFRCGTFIQADIGIKDGKIVFISNKGQINAEDYIDADGLIALPGLIDSHAHFRDPGYTHKEDFETGTRAAAAGGVTTVFDMPNVNPTVNSAERLIEHKKMASKKALIDFGHWVGPPASLEEIKDIIHEGAIGIKVFQIKDTKRSYPHMPSLGITDDGHLLEICRAVAEVGCILAVHPHNQELMEHIENNYFFNKGLTGPEDYAKARSYFENIIVDTAVATLVQMARVSGARIHLLHTASKESVKLIVDAKKRGLKITGEVNPAHIFLSWQDIKRIGPYALGRGVSEDDARCTWEALVDGSLDLIATDHAPHTKDEKEIGWKNMWKAPGGPTSIQDYLSLLLTEVNKGKIKLERVVELCSTRPAKLFRLYPKKGTIEVGSDADIVLVDLSKEKTIKSEETYSKCGWTSYDGRKVKGVPLYTIVRGKIVMKNGKVIGQPGYGEFVSPLS